MCAAVRSADIHPGLISLKRNACDERSTLRSSPPHPALKSVFTLASTVRELAAKKQRLGSNRVIDVICQLASALSHAAAHGVCHRDVRLETVHLIAVGGCVHIELSGFDCACSRSDLDARRVPALSAKSMPYRAPELLLNAHKCAMQFGTSDAWSLGCLFARLLNAGPVFLETADSEVPLLSDLFRKLGTPSPSALRILCDMEAAPLLRVAPAFGQPLPWQRIIRGKRHLTELDCLLLSRMLDWNPATRASAAVVLSVLQATATASGSPRPRHPRARLTAAPALAPIAEDDLSVPA